MRPQCLMSGAAIALDKLIIACAGNLSFPHAAGLIPTAARILYCKRDGTRPMTPIPSYRTGPRDTVMHALARAVEQHAEGEFANVDGIRITYGQADRQANSMARALAALGVRKGDTVVSLL